MFLLEQEQTFLILNSEFGSIKKAACEMSKVYTIRLQSWLIFKYSSFLM